MPDFRHIDTWLFDLDNTLYDANSGVFPQIDRNMKRFLMAEFGLPEEAAHAYQKELYRDYGTRLPGRKAIFTNASARHAENVAAKLGILDQFDAIFDIVSADYQPKPHISAYEKTLRHYGVEGRRAAMFEDLKRNLVPAAALGMTTVWIANDAAWSHANAGVPDDIDDHVHHTAAALSHFLHSIDIGAEP